jgi:hypothetical protein
MTLCCGTAIRGIGALLRHHNRLAPAMLRGPCSHVPITYMHKPEASVIMAPLCVVPAQDTCATFVTATNLSWGHTMLKPAQLHLRLLR